MINCLLESLSDQAALKMHQIIVKLRENKSKNAEERGQGQDEIAASSDYAEYLPKRFVSFSKHFHPSKGFLDL